MVQFQENNISTERNIENVLLNEEKILKMKKVDMFEDVVMPVKAKITTKERPNYVYNASNQALKPVQPKPAIKS